MCMFKMPSAAPNIVQAAPVSQAPAQAPPAAPTPTPSAAPPSPTVDLKKQSGDVQKQQEKERFAENRSRKGLSATSITGGLGVDEEAKVKTVTLKGY